MSTRSSFAHNIVKRAKDIGWKVDYTANGIWKIRCPEYVNPKTKEVVPPKTVQVHLTPSDVNFSETIMRDLDRNGFSEAEADVAKQNETERRARLQRIAEENQKELDRAQQHADAVAMASGRSRVDWNIILNPYPVPKTFERVLITPELATELLKLNNANRPHRARESEVWADVIRSGNWRYTHQGAALDSTGTLQDGQHRLGGIVLAEEAVEMQISIGMPPENFSAIDNGLRRTFGDVVAHHGYVNRNRVGTAARMLILYDDYPKRSFQTKVSNAEVANFITKKFDDARTNGDVLVAAANRGQAMAKGSLINASAATIGIFKLWELVGEDDEKVQSFIQGMVDGLHMDEDDPRYVFRRYLVSAKNRTTLHHVSLFIKAWNKFLAGAKVRTLAIRKNEDVPSFLTPEDEK